MEEEERIKNQRQLEELENERLLQEMLEQERLELEQARRQREVMDEQYECALCHMKFAFERMLFLDSCGHYFCQLCLAKHATTHVDEKRGGEITCPHCTTPLTALEVKTLLAPAKYDEYLTQSVTAVLAANPAQFTQCPNPQCGVVIERVHATTSANESKGELGPEGRPLTEVAQRHKNEFRMRCRECQTEFCAGCKLMPYHLGFTCEQHAVYIKSQHCRFCDTLLTPENTLRGHQLVCTEPDCAARVRICCDKLLPCTHLCGGVKDEAVCPPCLRCEGSAQQSGEDFCAICWTEALRQAPVVQLECGHMLHYECCKKKIESKWSGAVISFAFLDCPLCKRRMNNPALHDTLRDVLALYQDVESKALQRLKYLNQEQAKEIVDEKSRFHKDPTGYALNKFCYYLCYKCKKPYFGGERDCNAEQRVADYDPAELVCGGCSNFGNKNSCTVHGNDYIEYKCRFCCSVACWFCWGTTHFCEPCHRIATEIAKRPKKDLPKCTCTVAHPPNGDEYCLGCSLCRIQQEF